LWEALCGARPFQGDTRDELREAVLAGRRRGSPPGRVAALLARGLATDPAKRWPTLAALLDALDRARARRIMPWLAGGGVLVAGGVAVVALSQPAADPCPPPLARVDAAWGPARRIAIAAHLAEHDPGGAARAIAVGAVLDPGVEAWSAAHVAACR